ncbi:hypothetical protein [uncultured Cellulomonas sp.]|uniref:hypothetical protein n=1 Tax=uncultured Cellulomonas sp. TaxID=189682 RepID=UPI00261AE035|nr:hypothetical protein [uncultured Cellulomonas sp.]
MVALAALVAGGCTQQSGAAALVEGRTIPVAELDAATAELGPYLQDATPAAILVILVAEPTFERVAAQSGITVSDQQAREVLDNLSRGAQAGQGTDGAAPGDFSDGALSVARFTLLQQQLQQLPDAERVVAQLNDELLDLDVEVNPRYGRLDFAEGGILPADRPWLVAPDPA